MKRKFLSLIILLGVSFSTLFAESNNLQVALKIQQAKKLDIVVKRVNTVYDFINAYIMYMGTLPPNIEAIKNTYGEIVTEGYLSGNDFNMTITNNIVTFTNIIPSTLPDIVKQVYINNVNHYNQTIVNPVTLTMNMILKPQSINFLRYAQSLRSLPMNSGSVTVGISVDASYNHITPTCNLAHNGDVWYIPDANGQFVMNICTNPNWIKIGTDIEVAMVRNSFTDLSPIKAVGGTVAYAYDGAILKKYIYKIVDLNNDGDYADANEAIWVGAE